MWYGGKAARGRDLESYNRKEILEQTRYYLRQGSQQYFDLQVALDYLKYSATIFRSAEFYNPYELATTLNRMARSFT